MKNKVNNNKQAAGLHKRILKKLVLKKLRTAVEIIKYEDE